MKKLLIPIAVAGSTALLLATGASGASGPAAGVAGNKASYSPDISGTGRYVVFASDATNLVAGDTNGKRDIFIRDLIGKTTRVVTKGVAGRANGHSFKPSVSDDGRFVAFLSDATNLVSGDKNGVTDAFRADLSTGKVVRVSTGQGGVQANKPVTALAMNATGTSLVFASDATNLIPGDTNGLRDIFLRDLSTPAPRKISSVTGGEGPTISADGTWVGFTTTRFDGDDYAGDDSMAWNRGTGMLTRVCEGFYFPGAEDYCTLAVASNGGVSSASFSRSGSTRVYSSVDVRAKPAALSFSRGWGPYWDGDVAISGTVLDVTRFGATAVVQDDSGTGEIELAVIDKSGVLARLGIDGRAVSIAGDGSAVVLEQNRQIIRWNRASGVTSIVSVN